MVCIGVLGCISENENQSISRTELFMGTAIKVTLYGSNDEKILDKAFDKVKEIENLVSINKDETELTKLNENAGKNKVKLSDISYEIIKKGLNYSKLSNGGYDISIGPLVKLWSIGLEGARVPSKEEINSTIKNVDFSKIQLNDSTNEVFLSKENMMLDLGSIAKGYTADLVADVLKNEGIKSAIIDLGGNIYALGKKQGGKDFTIGIQNPFKDRGNVVASISASNKSIVTTGVYERFIEKDGTKYHHILNPKTGYPYETKIAGVSIVSNKSVDGDALSTLIFTKGLEEGLKLLEGLDGIDAVFIMENKDIYITSGIKDSFKLLDDNYKLCN